MAKGVRSSISTRQLSQNEHVPAAEVLNYVKLTQAIETEDWLRAANERTRRGGTSAPDG